MIMKRAGTILNALAIFYLRPTSKTASRTSEQWPARATESNKDRAIRHRGRSDDLRVRSFRGFAHMKAVVVASVAMLMLPSVTLAGPRSSTDYSDQPDALDAGGQRITSTAYRIDASVGGIGGIGTAPSQATVAKNGYVGQLYEMKGLLLVADPTTVNEAGTREITATASLDDESSLLVAPTVVQWSVFSGPITTISSGGIATAGNVYENTFAIVVGAYRGFSSTLGLTVLNTGNDDFGIYAGDQIDDAWQVNYFGENNPAAGPAQDPDGDLQNNLFVYLAITTPTLASSHFALRIENVVGQPNQRQLIFGPIAIGRTYRLVACTDLGVGTWSELPNTVQSDGSGERTVTDLEGTGPRKFYRIEISKP